MVVRNPPSLNFLAPFLFVILLEAIHVYTENKLSMHDQELPQSDTNIWHRAEEI